MSVTVKRQRQTRDVFRITTINLSSYGLISLSCFAKPEFSRNLKETLILTVFSTGTRVHFVIFVIFIEIKYFPLF
jgi:hypothetical protein